jgi:hypothetical protein
MSLRSRVKALEEDLKRLRANERLRPRWEGELAQEERQLRLATEHSYAMPRYGVDYSWGRPSTAALHDHGATFAARYLTGAGKALDRAEAQTLSRGGISIVSTFEEGAMAMLGGASQGRLDGIAAMRAAIDIGQPRGTPIYFACDFDIQDGQYDSALSYLHAADSVMSTRYFVGVYGGLGMVNVAASHFHFLWQTLAWSRGAWNGKSQIRQTAVGTPTIDGVECDTDLAYSLDFGQWKV